MKTITVTVSPNGDTKIEANGFTGGECRLATANLRQGLGQDSDEQLKPEYSQTQLNGAIQLHTGRPIGN